ncbi:uncharacterized protein LOC103505216 [Diaphorina citri]|uniref:Uncharacterized protein LOC103505216 n=1 Tax=Diaphorina citri TaxID=121845 RepID=A0A1S3CU01_DIACI|nr:uncharacterized protein LOC103505216 [Diaphorina citri]KAI5702079.1 hypothetical protein M8J75_016367 [Diaphorina citri]KAI5730455.1 hypothetical protein M8J76_013813 [Diaphorina citri]KAI5735244.1 hypothetical protein M8J77_016129 [Diaphorina citri]
MLRSWTIALLVLLLAGVAKAGYHFIRLALMAGMGLIGLWLLHKLAQDYNKIRNPQKAVKAAGRLLGLWKRSIPDDPLFDQFRDPDQPILDPFKFFDDKYNGRYDEDDISLNVHPNFDTVLYFDQNECARRLVCQLATRNKDLNQNESTILKLIKMKSNQKDSRSRAIFQEAADVGYKSKDPKKCKEVFKKCRFTDWQMQRVIRVF